MGRDTERRHAVHEAGRQPPQPAVAERGVRLQRAQLVEIDAQAGQRGAGRLHQIEIGQRVEQQAPDEKFDREVVDLLPRRRLVAPPLIHPAVDDAIAHRERGGDEPIVRAGAGGVAADRIGELAEDCSAKFRHIREVRGQRLGLAQMPHSSQFLPTRPDSLPGLSGRDNRVCRRFGTRGLRGRSPLSAGACLIARAAAAMIRLRIDQAAALSGPPPA